MALRYLLIPMLLVVTVSQLWFALPQDTRPQLASEPAPVGDPTRGARIAISCSACHGEAGVSSDAWIPSLAGMNQQAIYKQLNDYRSHRRRPEWYMASVAQALSPQDSADVSAFYATQMSGLTTLAEKGDWPGSTASCGRCHNPQEKAPQIVGQQAEYLEIQMSLFAQGIRSNDSDEVMRKIARKLTSEEIHRITESLGSKPAEMDGAGGNSAHSSSERHPNE